MGATGDDDDHQDYQDSTTLHTSTTIYLFIYIYIYIYIQVRGRVNPDVYTQRVLHANLGGDKERLYTKGGVMSLNRCTIYTRIHTYILQ